MWATYVPISVFLGLSVLDLGPMYAIDVRRRQTEVRRASLLNAPIPQGGGMTTANHSCGEGAALWACGAKATPNSAELGMRDRSIVGERSTSSAER